MHKLSNWMLWNLSSQFIQPICYVNQGTGVILMCFIELYAAVKKLSWHSYLNNFAFYCQFKSSDYSIIEGMI